MRVGTLIGSDKYGNKYYEDKKHYFFGESNVSIWGHDQDICTKTLLFYSGLWHRYSDFSVFFCQSLIKGGQTSDGLCTCFWVIHKWTLILSSVCSGRHRWVIYTTEMNGKNTLWEVDGSMVPAEWYDPQCYRLSTNKAATSQATFVLSTVHLKHILYIWEVWTTVKTVHWAVLFLFTLQASLAALHDRWPPHHTSTRAKEVPGWHPPVQREW